MHASVIWCPFATRTPASKPSGVTWPELAVAVDYSNKGEPDQYTDDDARRAGQALERWFTTAAA